MSDIPKTQTGHQFTYSPLPPPGRPTNIESSVQDKDDPAVQQAISVGPWKPLGPVLLVDERGPAPYMCWTRELTLPDGFLAPKKPPAETKSNLIELPPGTRIEDVVRRR